MGRRKYLIAGSAVVAAGLLVLAGCGAVVDSAGSRARASQPLPPAEDRPEPDAAISGRFPLQSQLTEAATGGQGYRKGMRLVGVNPILYPGMNMPRGQNFQLGWMGDCAYVGTADLTQFVAHRYYMTPLLATAADAATGMAVIDAADPQNPQLVQIIPNPEVVVNTDDPGEIPGELGATPPGQLPNTHRAMAMAWFAITSHEGRRVLVAGAHTLLALFDATDCRNPVLKSTMDLHHRNVAVHGLRLSQDGRRLYVSGVLSFDATAVIDISDLASPRVLKIYEHGAHDVELNATETRMYMNSLTGAGQNNDPNESDSEITGGGLRIVDITGIAACSGGGGGHGGHGGHGAGAAPGECNVEFREITEYEWVGLSHATRLVRINGRPYALTVDEYSTDSQNNGCEPGWVRVIDVSNESDPQRVGDIRLGVSRPENCGTVRPDNVVYNAHYIEVDDPADTQLVFAAWYASGLRVFDVRDPEAPVEIAYLMPPASSETVYQSNFARPIADSTISHVRWRPDKRHLWVVNVNGGFTILEFTDTALLPPGYFN